MYFTLLTGGGSSKHR